MEEELTVLVDGYDSHLFVAIGEDRGIGINEDSKIAKNWEIFFKRIYIFLNFSHTT